MTYLIIAVIVLAITDVFTLTLLKRRNEDVRFYKSEAHKQTVFTEKARLNSKRWSELNGGRLK
ncbi:hypothetical protein CAC02_10820 [Streptococcus gallolyticus]|uniref:Uncharacterized protein n=1 Tax=Streptococcus gallolyticus TaxID=315405 RepID=A0A368UAF5_9STRE|nr:hypothetical protein [Streptococcus gallolyticus]RCW15905.1 hypothetical protein CAC02_10820 [Streptococcus gallolyticus]